MLSGHVDTHMHLLWKTTEKCMCLYGTIAGDFFLISSSSGGNHGTFDMHDCVQYRFKMRAGFVKPSLFHQCDVSEI